MFLLAFLVVTIPSASYSATSNQTKIDAYVDAITDDVYRQITGAKLDRYPLQPFNYKIASTGEPRVPIKWKVYTYGLSLSEVIFAISLLG